MRSMFHNWPFDEDEVVTLHWIASPKINSYGEKKCKVFFRTETGMIKSVSVSWGSLPTLLIGDTYINGKPHGKSLPVREISISTDHIDKLKAGRAADTIPPFLYGLRDYSIFGEWCCSFEYNGYSYYVPCVELTRVFLASNSVLANQLLSSGGLENMIDLSSWHQLEHEVSFNFRDETPGISEGLAKTFAAIYGTPQLFGNWKYTYSQYVNSGLIKTPLPEHAVIKLSFKEANNSKKRFVYSIDFINIRPLPKEVYYGPEKLVHSGEKSVKNGIVKCSLPSDDSKLDLTGTLAKRTQFTAEVASGCSFLSRMNATRSTSNNRSPSKTKTIKLEDTAETFSVGDVSTIGKQTFVNLEMREVYVNTDPDFTSFCKAIKLLGKYSDILIADISFVDLPEGGRVSYLNMPSRCLRKYACVTLQKREHMWLIIELCNKDGYSISTLFTKCTGNKEELANRIVRKLLHSNGSWSQECFPKHIFKTLDHHRHRTAERWAELMYNKMR